MLFNQIKPLHKFIVTDVVKSNRLNRYSSGYIYKAEDSPMNRLPYTYCNVIVTKVGKSGKPRIQHKEMYVCPLVFKKISDKGYYKDLSHIITKPVTKNVLDMTNFEFMTWAYAVMMNLKSNNIGRIWSKAFDASAKKILRACDNFGSEYSDGVLKLMSSPPVRIEFVQRMQLVKCFVRHNLKKEANFSSLEQLLKKHYSVAKDLDDRKMAKLAKTMLGEVKEGKSENLIKELSVENDNVTSEYENSGYWF